MKDNDTLMEAAVHAQIDLLDHLWSYKDQLRKAGRRPAAEDYESYFGELRQLLKDRKAPIEACIASEKSKSR